MVDTARIAVTASITVVTLLASAVPAAATSGPPERCGFRLTVALSHTIVVGRIISTEAVDASKGHLVSHLLVEDCLYGACGAGDTLDVHWWDLAALGVSLGGRPLVRLDRMVGEQRALWLLMTCDVTRTMTVPIVLSAENAVALRQRLSWLRSPPDCDMLMLSRDLLQSGVCNDGVGVDAESANLKLSRVADCIAKFLDESPGSGLGKAGRSN